MKRQKKGKDQERNEVHHSALSSTAENRQTAQDFKPFIQL